MSLDSDIIVDRRRIRRKLTFWRVMAALIAVQGLTDRVKTRLLLLGLYWHFLDLIWIGILSVVFLGGMA